MLKEVLKMSDSKCLNCKYNTDCQPWEDEPVYDFCIAEKIESGKIKESEIIPDYNKLAKEALIKAGY